MARIKPQALLLQSKKKKGPSRINVTTILLYIIILVVMMYFAFAVYKSWSRRSTIQTQEDLSASEDENPFVELKKSDIPKYAFISTSKGLITVELYKDGSPDIVSAFVNFCQKSHFKGMQFTRVIKNFVVHGSKVERPEYTEDWTSRGKHYSRLGTSLKHEAFMLGTSKTKQKGGGFDLFITTAPIPDLNDKINVFGRVIKGEDVVQEIEEVDTDDHYRPKAPVQINEVTLKFNI